MENKQLILDFIAETKENLSSFEKSFSNIQQEFKPQYLDEAYRAIHTIKGSSGYLGFKYIHDISHHLENLFDKFKKEKREITKESIDFLLIISKLFRRAVTSIKETNQECDHNTKPIIYLISLLLEGKSIDQEILIDLQKISKEINFKTTEVHTYNLNTGMQPISNIVGRIELLIGDMIRLTGKEIAFVTHGMNTELDHKILEKLIDPLTHIIRNSSDHGIEKKGKILFSAYHEAGQVIIDISDDGLGLNIDKISKMIIEMKLITNDELNILSENDIFKFILYPGFSTASSVSVLSGRGIGMDVVKNDVESIGGSIDLISQEGIGTTIRLSIPT